MINEPARRWEVTASYDFGQFFLQGGPSDVVISDVVDRAIASDGIAQEGSFIVVLTGNQWNSNVRLAVELWPSQPPDDLDQWEQAFDAAIEVVQQPPSSRWQGLTYHDMTGARSHAFDLPPGTYELRIAARGFEGPRTDHDVWRIQAWPSTRLTSSPQRLKP